MPTPSRFPAILMVLPLFFLFSCKKGYDFVKDNPPQVATCCQVQTVNLDDAIFYKITYNAAGNPVSYTSAAFAYFSDQYFRYDRQGRLKDCIATNWGTTNSVLWDRYSYPAPGLMSDSTFENQGDFTQHTNPPYPRQLTGATLYHLDSEDRPISYTTITPSGKSSGTMKYDRDGNQVIPGVVYDDQVNIYQTNKVWQQIFKDYSRNNPNPWTIEGYNNYRLPITYLSNTLHQPNIFFLPLYDYLIRITYSCDSTKLLTGSNPLGK